MKRLFTLVLSTALIYSCSNADNSNTQPKETSPSQTIIGKKATLTYPSLTAEVTYLSEQQIHWKTTDPSGNVAEETDSLNFEDLGNGLFFLSWIEQDGTTVSQVIDTSKEEVTAYLSYNDESGKRIGQKLKGSFKLQK